MNKNKVIWHEGLFLRPQHFQQQDRFLQHWIEQRCQGLIPYSWGITELDLDHHALNLGKININYCRGIFPDGTPFEIPNTTSAPEPLIVTDEIKNSRIYLALPMTQNNTLEVASPESKHHALSRYHTNDLSIKDWHTENIDSEADLQVGTLNIKLLTDQDKQHGFVTIPLTHVIERNNEEEVKLNADFITSVLHCQASPQLLAFIKEIQGLLKHRSETLAHRIATPNSNGLAEITDFLLLQTINRAENTLRHLYSLDHLHPETFYRTAVELAGELATFTRNDRRAIPLPHYIHTDLQACFTPVMNEIRRALSFVNEQRAIPIELTLRKFGVWVGIFKDKSLLDNALFVLAAKANLASEQIRTKFPKQTTVATVEHIRQLVSSHLPGVELSPLPVAPREIPYHANFNYFEINTKNQYWQALKSSGGLAIHIGTNLPELELELWAIRHQA